MLMLLKRNKIMKRSSHPLLSRQGAMRMLESPHANATSRYILIKNKLAVQLLPHAARSTKCGSLLIWVVYLSIWHIDFEPELKHLPGVFRVPEY